MLNKAKLIVNANKLTQKTNRSISLPEEVEDDGEDGDDDGTIVLLLTIGK